MKNSFGKSFIKFVLVVVLVTGVAWVIVNRQAVIDWARLVTYTPNAEVKALADNTQMQQYARNLFYASNPQIQDSTTFNQSCSSNEKTIVLGCYKAQQIYIFNVKDARFDGIKEVTAVHEMLHAVYERMTDSERQRVDALLQPLVENMKDARLIGLVDLYNKTEPGQLYNEMHSILGTEVSDLTPELEEYYAQYFSRREVVGYANRYQTLFNESKSKIQDYDRQLRDLRSQIDKNNALLSPMLDELNSINSRMNQHLARNQIDEYNALVPTYNQKFVAYNALIAETRDLANRHNAMVIERNQQVAAQDNLYDSINSNYQPATKN